MDDSLGLLQRFAPSTWTSREARDHQHHTFDSEMISVLDATQNQQLAASLRNRILRFLGSAWGADGGSWDLTTNGCPKAMTADRPDDVAWRAVFAGSILQK
ncbi:hypothetical protein ACFYE9_11895 [Rhizobium leguminosarum]|uniref:Uncharacterized protein n=1 Tax=Rhizobium leguminosarum TaxID=384 RepID=A0ACD5F6H9_RHILE|nr:hypothetical protein [Rhizobium leguminosarum]